MATDNKKAHIALITANILFGLNYSYSKSIMPEFMTPAALTLLRIGFTAILLVVLFVVMKHEKVEKKDVAKLAIASLLGLVLNQLIFLNGLRLTSPVDASIITTGIPMLVLLISATFIKEKITLIRLIGIIIGGIGAVLVIIYGGISSLGAGKLSGNILVFTSSICYAGYLVWTKPLTEKYSPLTIMTYMFVMGTLFTMPFLGSSLVKTDFSSFTPQIWGAVTFVLLCSTLIAYLCIAYSLRRVKPTTVAIYQYSQPIVAAFFAIFRGQDSLDGVKIFSAILVFVGVFIVTQSSRFEHLMYHQK